MPLIIPKDLIAEDILKREKIFTMPEDSAVRQDIRPLKVGIVNLMPIKEVTEIQLLRMLSNTALQIDIDLIRMGSYQPRNTDMSHLEKFYKTYEEIKDQKYDAFIVTGAPVETLPYSEIKYWEELRKIFDFVKENVYSTMFICWGAQAALHYFYGISNELNDKKIFGIYDYQKIEDSKLMKGFDDVFASPQSRYSYVKDEEILKHEDLKILATREDTGVNIAASRDYRFIFSFGHFEYDKDTLHQEYIRDLSKSLEIDKPINYYVDDDPEKGIVVRWRSSGNLFFSNWINYCVYQETPYDIETIEDKKVSKFGGSSLADASQFKKVKDIILNKEDRNVIVVSAPGRRDSKDTKVTDDLVKVYELKESLGNIEKAIEKLEYERDLALANKEELTDFIKDRFLQIGKDLGFEDYARDQVNQVVKAVEKSNSLDFIISRGEYLNAIFMAKYLGYRFVDAVDLIYFDKKGHVDEEKSTKAIENRISEGDKVVVPGFYGVDHLGQVKTFKRGGSDYTGSLLASALGSSVYENWTDVSGVMSADPKLWDDAERIPYMDYQSFLSIIDERDQVYQRDAVNPVKEKNITLKILNTNDPEGEGTEIKD